MTPDEARHAAELLPLAARIGGSAARFGTLDIVGEVERPADAVARSLRRARDAGSGLALIDEADPYR